MRKLILLVVLVGVCSGCAGQPTKWCKQGATAEGLTAISLSVSALQHKWLNTLM